MSMRHLPYEALVFDLGGVIIPHDNEVLYRRLAERCAAPDALDRIRRGAQDPRYGTGELPIADLHDRFRRELGYSRDWDAFVADWCSHLSVDWAMLDLVQRLAASRRVLLFSNTNREHWEHLLALTDGALARFEAYLSHEIGQVKPALAAFRTVAARAGIMPARSLFIDDRAENVEAARQAGFDAERFTDQAAFERFLRSRMS
jgi:FMN phosphatase YigB (HAD superfamily)